MACLSVIYLVTRLILFIKCESVTSETKVLPTDEQDLLSGAESLNDDDLWNLLKQLGRNDSGDPFEGFTNYEDYTLVDNIYPTDTPYFSELSTTENERGAYTNTELTISDLEKENNGNLDETTTYTEPKINSITEYDLQGETSTTEGEFKENKAFDVSESNSDKTVETEPNVSTPVNKHKYNSVTRSSYNTMPESEKTNINTSPTPTLPNEISKNKEFTTLHVNPVYSQTTESSVIRSPLTSTTPVSGKLSNDSVTTDKKPGAVKEDFRRDRIDKPVSLEASNISDILVNSSSTSAANSISSTPAVEISSTLSKVNSGLTVSFQNLDFSKVTNHTTSTVTEPLNNLNSGSESKVFKDIVSTKSTNTSYSKTYDDPKSTVTKSYTFPSTKMPDGVTRKQVITNQSTEVSDNLTSLFTTPLNMQTNKIYYTKSTTSTLLKLKEIKAVTDLTSVTAAASDIEIRKLNDSEFPSYKISESTTPFILTSKTTNKVQPTTTPHSFLSTTVGNTYNNTENITIVNGSKNAPSTMPLRNSGNESETNNFLKSVTTEVSSNEIREPINLTTISSTTISEQVTEVINKVSSLNKPSREPTHKAFSGSPATTEFLKVLNVTKHMNLNISDFSSNEIPESTTPFTLVNKMTNKSKFTSSPHSVLSAVDLTTKSTTSQHTEDITMDKGSAKKFSTMPTVYTTIANNFTTNSTSIKKMPISYNVTTSKMETILPTISSKIDKVSSTTSTFLENNNKKITKMKTSLDPAKKVFISLEEGTAPTFNLKDKSFSASTITIPLLYSRESTTLSTMPYKSKIINKQPDTLFKNKNDGIKNIIQQNLKKISDNSDHLSLIGNINSFTDKKPTSFVFSSTSPPNLQTTSIFTKQKSALESGRKFFLIPENKMEPTSTQSFKHKVVDDIVSIPEIKYKNTEDSTTIKPCNRNSNSLGNINILHGSRTFMIDEITQAPTEIDRPFFISKCCNNNLNNEKRTTYESTEDKRSDIKIPSENRNLFKYYNQKGKETNVSQHSFDDLHYQQNKNATLAGKQFINTGSEKQINENSKKKHTFDPKRMHIIDESPVKTSRPTATTTNIKKSTFDINYKFSIDSADVKVEKTKEKEKITLSKDVYTHKKVISHPVIRIIPNFDTSHISDDQHSQVKYSTSQGDAHEQLKNQMKLHTSNPQNYVPEFLCFEIKNREGKPILSCAPLNSTSKSNVRHFFTNIHSGNQPSNHQKAPFTIRQVLLKNKNNIGTSVVIKTLPKLNQMKFSISGGVSHSEINNSDAPKSEVILNTPKTKILVTNTQMQHAVRHSIVPLQHIANQRNLLFLEKSPNFESYQQRRFPIIEKKIIYSRSKRSTLNNCNMDGVYDDEGSSLAFVFDNTMSMSSELEQMQKTAVQITMELTEKKKNVIRDYVLVTFNDPEVAAPFCTNNYNELINALNSITVHGGNDCPELALTGLKSALKVVRPNSFIFVITDADAKDYFEEENIQPLIMRKTPFIFFLMTERCYHWPHQKGFDVFYSISEQTNGQIIMMDKADVKGKSLLRKLLGNLTEDYLQKGIVPFTKISSKVPSPVPYSVPVPVELGTKKVTFVITGSKPTLDITDPKGGKPPGNTKEFPKYISVTYKEPLSGVWKATVSSSTGHSFSSYGISTTQIKVGFSVLKTNKFSETSHRPLKSAENYVLVDVSNPELVGNISHIDLVNLRGNLLSTIHLTRDPTSSKLYIGGPFIPPNENFNLEINGYGSNGSPLKRISSTAILPQLPELPYVTLPTENTIEEGNTYVIKCHVESLVPITVKVYKKHDSYIKVHNMKQTGDVHFELLNISLKDQGVYVCWASNVAGINMKEIKITVLVKPPKVSVKDEVLFTTENPAQIPCIVYSNQPYTTTWKKGTSSRWNNIQNTPEIYSTEKGLIIPNPTNADEGWYQCIASNIGGDSAGTTYLKLSIPPAIEIAGLRRFYKHFNITITCSAISGIPSPELKWEKNGVEFTEDNKRVFITYLEKYTKIEILNAVEDDEGSYTCSAVNFAGQDSKDLNLSYEEKPRAVASEKMCNIIHGGNCTLKCLITGRPMPDVIWKKDDISINPLSSSNIQILFDQSLLLNNAKLSDSGVYSCTAQSSIGYSEDSIVVQVTGLSPKIIEAPVDTSIEIGENGRLSCIVAGIPQPKIIWKKNYKILNKDIWDENVLEINNATLSDSGVYVCAAENILGLAEAQALVNITGGVLPILNKEKDLEVRKVLIGEKVEFPCIVIGGKPMPLKEWYKDGNLLSKQISTGIKLENGSYFISSVSSLDTGLYECVARNELGYDVKKIHLKFHEPPRIDLSVSSNVVATVGKSAKLICKVTGDPMPNVTWKRHVYSNNKTMRGIHLEDTNELVFETVTEEDSGRYICQAENIAGVARRAIALSVMVPPKIVSWPIEKFVEAGNIVTLECRSRAIPRPSIQWFKNNITIPKSKYYGQFLRFYAEATDSGTYSCIAENRAGKDIVETNLIVLVPPQIKDGDIIIKAISGSEAVLPCDVSGNPQPSITWHLNGEVIRKQTGSESATLRLQNVTEADAGTYVCIAKNKAGANKKKMELIVLTPPKVLPWTEPIKVVTGEYFNVTCQTFANPEARISWYKDRQPLPLDYIKKEKNLEFVVEKNNKGIYTCEARNEAGKDSKDFLLVILDPPVFALHLPYTVDVLHGSDIEIPCVAFGDPKPIMSWNRNDIILQNDIRRIVNSVTGQLTILNAAPEDDGYYNCTASNKAGLVWRTVEVNVLELPTAALTVSNSIVNQGDEVEFNCNITGKPRPKISWKKDGKILSTENDSKLRLTAYYNDRGNYTCIVKNLAGEDYSTVSIDVSVPPSISGSNEERIIVLKGASIIMNCSSEGIPEPEIIWFLNETKIEETDENLVANQGILTLKSIATENAGIYSCVARNIAGSVNKTFTVYVHAKPMIIDQMDTKILINEGKDFSVQCSADGIPKPKITWKKGDKNIDSKSYSDVSMAVHDNILLLFNSDVSTEGIYTCLATNMEGQDTKSYEITVQADKKKVREGVKEIELVEGNNVVMNCDSKPGSEIIWLKDTKNLNKMPLERADDVHFFIGDDGKFLNIAEVYLEDTGLYSCIAMHPDGNSTTFFSVNVKFPPYFSDLFPTLEYTVRENKSISLNCPANGNPTPQINWRLAENNLPISAFTLPGVQISSGNGNTLLIKSAKYTHSGLYLCSASNTLGKENRIFNVKVIGPPQRQGPEVSDIEIVSGNKLELNCTIDGSPYPNFKWNYIPESGQERTLRYATKSIYIGNVQVEDEGLYTCFASNTVGNSTKTFNVSVIETPRIKRDLNNTIVLAEGDDLKLACKCEGRKPASVKWFFNGFHLNMSKSIVQDFYADFNTTEYTCKVKNVSKETEGSYSCLVSNIAGSDEEKYEVAVIAAPKMLNDEWRKLRKLQFFDGSKIEIKCPVESVDDFKIQWKKNGLLMPQFENQTLNIFSSTVDDEAEYICIASNIAGQLASKFEVTVLASPKLLNLHDNTTKKVFLDGKLFLNCSVSGNPAPQILWTKNIKQINNITFPQVIFSQNNQILEIDEVDSSDSGKYSCYCSNIAGFIERHFDVEIIVPPMINEENKSLEKIVKTVLYRRVVLRCPLVAKPEPNITWYKDSEEINQGDPLFLISYDKKMLIINHPRESDVGMYKCIGKNDIGDKAFTFFLHITIIMDWGQWNDWSKCSSSCGGGKQVRQRECLGERNEILSEYIHFQNNSCYGPNMEQRPCNSHSCPINGMWSSWSEWSDCSTTCGEGVMRRTRRCNNPPPTYGGEDCIGETYEDKSCELEPCPVNGNWGEWSDWSECTATCGYSLKMRTRRCNNPAPAYGGISCSGNSRDITVCKKRKCEETHIGWSSWSGWSSCSVTCGIGRQTRKRVCLGGVFSKSCLGESRQNKLCQKEPCQRRRFARSAELNIYGELNGSPIEETYIAEIEENSNETEITAVPQNITKNNSSMPNLPFIISPVSWLAAHESDDGKNGFSVTNGSFHENATYLFATGEEMEMQSDAEIEDPSNPLKMYIQVSGKAPIENKATIVIDPYEEDIVQTDRKTMRSSSNTVLQTNGKSIPVSWRKKIEFPENMHKRISPVERLKSKRHHSKYNNNKKRIEYQTAAVVTSKFEDNSCPVGFQYDEDTGECHDINECVRKWLNKCYQTEVCINTIGSYSCECREGFRERPNKGDCKDINECLEGLHMCSHTCQNTKGSYQCLCPFNMILSEDLFNCVEASEEEYNEYSMDLDNIDYFEHRSSYITRVRPALKKNNRNGIRNLVHSQDEKNNRKEVSRASRNKTNTTCKPGFKIGKYECEDVNECLEDEYACTKEQLCMNTPGSHVCIDAPCPDKFIFSPETRSCLLLCLENEVDCTDGALLSESLQIIVVPVYRANYTFYPFTEILVLSSYDDNNLPLDESIYNIVQNESGLPVRIRSEKKVGVLYAANYFEVEKKERLILMSSNYDSNGDKLHSTMFLIIIYNTKSLNI